jgi:Glycosyltransferase Family 4
VRILTTCVDPNPDAGAPGVTLRLVAAHRNLGHDVQLISYADLPKLRVGNLKPTYFAIFLAAAFLVKKEWRNVDVIDTSDGQAWLLFAAARLFGNRPLLVNRSHRPIGVFRTTLIANICSTGKKPTLRARTYMEWRYREFLWSFDLADVGLVLNQDEASFVQKHTKLPAKSCRVITNGIATAFLGLSAPEQPDRHAPLEIVQIGPSLWTRESRPRSRR